MPRPADHGARAEALDTRRSFAVAAPAGSGKTGLLTQRILCLLAEVEEPEQILCMTFTRKAAGEMRQRLIQTLTEALDSERPGASPPGDDYQRTNLELARRVLARDRRQNWQLIAAPRRLRILTIDSFCRQLAAQLAVESGFGELPEPVENPQRHYQLAIHELLEELETDTALGEALGQLLSHVDNDTGRLEALLSALAEKREQWLPHILAGDNTRAGLEQAARHLIAETLEAGATVLAPQASDIALLADYAAQNLVAANNRDTPLANCLGLDALPDGDSGDLPAWLGLCDLFLTRAGEWRKSINKNTGFPSKKDSVDPDRAEALKKHWQALNQWCQEQAGLLELLNDIRYLPAAAFEPAQWRALEALTLVLPQLSARLKLVFGRENACDYTEITLAALTALGPEDAPTDLTLRLDHQIRHILVDEFQDTSTVHFEILRRLTGGWQEGDGRTLFLVGDAMQSLYGFRNANVGLFMDVRRHALGQVYTRALDLTVNFRSQAGIIDWVNRLFSDVFPARANTSRGAVPYASSEPFKPPLDGPAVCIDVFDGDHGRLLEAECVAAKVLAARALNPTASIAILVRGRAHLRDILPALRARDIRWQATDIDPLANTMAVMDLVSLTRAMTNPADRIAWLALLRAPWCGLDLEDLLYLTISPVATNPVPSGERYALLPRQVLAYREVDRLSEAGRLILARVAPLLATAWRQRFRKPLRSWLEGLWLALGGPETLEDGQSLRQCRQYWDLLEAHDEAGTIADWPTFTNAVEQLYAKPEVVSPGNEPDQPPPIQIMTIHKAKGLEFDTVILPGLERRTRNNDPQLLLWRERVAAHGRTELLLSPPQRAGGERDATYEHLRREESLKNRLESTRVLYVACTRAVNHLHLLFTRTSDKDPSGDSLLATLWPALKPELEHPQPDCRVTCHDAGVSDSRQDAEVGAGLAVENDDYRYQWRLPPDWRGDHPRRAAESLDPSPTGDGNRSSDSVGSDDSFEDSIEDSIEDSFQDSDDDARKTGIVFHRTLQYLVLDGLAAWDDQRMARQHLVWREHIDALAITDPEQALTTLKQALQSCLNDFEHQWIFDHRLEDSACELPLTYLDASGKARLAIIDRSFIHRGQRWIIDYKLAATGAMQNLSNGRFIEQQIARYRPQLQHYASLFRALESLPVTTALYFPLQGRLEVLTP